VEIVSTLRSLKAKGNVKPHVKVKAYIERFDEKFANYASLIKEIV
jgi:hypothetical protein